MPSIDELRSVCRKQGLIWSTRRGSDALGLTSVFDDMVVLCLSGGSELDTLSRVRFVFYEGLTGVRRTWAVAPRPFIDATWSVAEPFLARRRWRVVTSAASPRVARWAKSTRSLVNLQSSTLVRSLTHKAALFAILDELGLPRLPGEWARAGSQSFAYWKRRFRGRFVVQLPASTAGRGTAVVQTPTDWARASGRFAGQTVWLAPFAGELSLNVNAIALATGTVVAYPSIQLTGIESLGYAPGSYCGNDYTATATLPQHVLDDIRLQTARIGDALVARGYDRLFGLDFVVSAGDGRPHAVDLNPRWQGSTPLLTQAQIRAGRACLPATAVVLAAGLLDSADVTQRADDYFLPVVGAQAFVPWQGSMRAAPTQSPRWGIHGRGAPARWKRPGLMLGELEPGEMLVGDAPRPAVQLDPRVPWFRISTLESMLDRSRTPVDWIGRVPGEIQLDEAGQMTTEPSRPRRRSRSDRPS